MSTPNSVAALLGKYGSLRNSRARKTTSALFSSMILFASCEVVIKPTAPVKSPVDFLIFSAKLSWYNGLTGIFTSDAFPPVEQSIKSIVFVFKRVANFIESSSFHAPSFQSVADILKNKGFSSVQTFLTLSIISNKKRTRFSNELPYWSVRLLLIGDKNSLIK